MANWRELDEGSFRAHEEDIADRERHKAIWDSHCENCGERLSNATVWIERHASEPDDEAEDTYYCPKCIAVDVARNVRRPDPRK